MDNKVILILVDGMRPDAVVAADHPVAKRFMAEALYSLETQTVMPSVTLPCHMSLFHSVPPDRHGIITNTYTPLVRPLDGLVERLGTADKKCGFFYNWEELRDLSRPGRLAQSEFYCGHAFGFEETNEMVTSAAVKAINTGKLDFMFVYLGWVDEAGHANGWMSDEYMRSVRISWDEIGTITGAAKDYTVIVTADHGGHGRGHGADIPEDMTIPLFIRGSGINAGKLDKPSIMDIAPTVTKLLGASNAPEWEGKALL